MDSLTLRTPISVAELVSDYVRHALDEVTSLAGDMGDHAAVQAGLISPSRTSRAARVPQCAPLVEPHGAAAEQDEESSYRAEVSSFRQRTARLLRVAQCLRRWEQRQRPAPSSSLSASPSPRAEDDEVHEALFESRAGASSIRRAVAALGACSHRMGASGLKVPERRSASPPSPSLSARPAPPGTPVSFPQASLNVYGRNTQVVFRRPKPSARPSVSHGAPTKAAEALSADPAAASRKRPWTETSAEVVGPPSSSHLTSVQVLSSAQKKARWQLYTCRDALLPPVDRLASSERVHGPPLSPALRLFNRLNASAEAAMLSGAWKVTTKAQLLQDLPRLHETVHTVLHDNLRKAFFRDMPGLPHTASDSAETGARSVFSPPAYFRVAACNEGVVRLVVQDALYADLTFDLAKKAWSVCRLHWNLWTTASAATLMNTPRSNSGGAAREAAGDDATAVVDPPLAVVVADGAEPRRTRLTVPADRPVFLDALLSVDTSPEWPSSTASTSSSSSSTALRRVLPEHAAAMHTFVQKQFADDGFTAGCLALNQLVCAVAMDLLVRQLQALKADFFVGPLRSAFSLDVRAGTFVAFHLLTPPLVASETCATPLKPLHVRCDLAGGTVLVDQVWGTDVAGRRRTLLLHPAMTPSEAVDAARPVVVDAEALLWSSYSA